MKKSLDVICLGRVAVDLYGDQIGGRLEDMQSFAKYLGGSSGNLAAGLALSIDGLDPDLLRTLQPAAAEDVLDMVLLGQAGHALDQASDDAVAPLGDGLGVGLHVSGRDAELR